MATLKEINNRIKSIKNTQQITKTMQMVAAARLKKTEMQYQNAALYGEKIANMAKRLASSPFAGNATLYKKREVRIVCLVVVTSDRGLCGSYNSSIIKKAEEFLKKYEDSSIKIKLIFVGKKGFDYFKNKDFDIEKSFIDFGGKIKHNIISEISSLVPDLFLAGKVDEVYLLYTHYKSAISCTPVLEKFLNMEKDTSGSESEKNIDYIFEPDLEEIMETLLPSYIRSKILLSIAESFVSENSSRMVAMKSATDNAGEMIEDITRERNKTRQASITTEILEIVSGSEALKKKK